MNTDTTSGIENGAIRINTTLPTAMTSAAFMGIAWYLCAELNVRLFLRCNRRSLYWYSCLVCSWGLIIHAIAITLSNFKIWEDYGSIVVIHLTWCTFVVSQSVVLYSRLNLVLKAERTGRYVLHAIITTAAIFGLGTVILGMIARYPTMIGRLGRVNLIWDKVQLAVFFLQETAIGILYIKSTYDHLKHMTLLGSSPRIVRRNLRHLIEVNVFIIILDCSLIGLCYAGFFFLQGFYKVAVYAIKLRTEFTILNQLRSSLPGASSHESGYGVSKTVGQRRRRNSQDSDVEMVAMASNLGRIRVQKSVDVVVSPRMSQGDGNSQEAVRTVEVR
ncbi:hypothetical protein ACN47E_009287 [Coniothyrium glycines]